MSVNVPAEEIQANLARLLKLVAHCDTPVIIAQQGNPCAAVLSIERLNYLQSLEDEHDFQDIKRILSDPITEYVSYEQARTELELS